MKKKRAPLQPRAIPPQYPTLNAELADTQHFPRFYVGFHPQLPPHTNGPRGIRDRENPDYFDARPSMMPSALYDIVARLNAGESESAISRGKARKPRLQPNTPAARWVEFLLAVKETRSILQEWIETKRPVSLNDVRWLLTYRNPETGLDFTRPVASSEFLRSPPATAYECLPPEYKRLVNAVAKQLQRVLDIRLDIRNDRRAAKKG